MKISDSIQKVSFPYEPSMYVQPMTKKEAIEEIAQIEPQQAQDLFQREKDTEQTSLFPISQYNQSMKGSILDVYA